MIWEVFGGFLVGGVYVRYDLSFFKDYFSYCGNCGIERRNINLEGYWNSISER